MENLPRNLEKDLVKAAEKPSKFKKKEKWTLLLINDSGKTIQIKGIQILAKAAVFLILTLVLSAGGIYSYAKIKNFGSFKSFISMSDVSTKQGEKENFSNKTISNKKEVNLPSTAKENINENQGKVEADKNKNNPVTTETLQKPKTDKKPEQIKSSERIQETSPVLIDDFECSYKAGRDVIEVKFNIKNNASDSDSVSGHAIVVLKDNKNNPGKWIALPDDVKLVSGRPTGEDTGQTFSISFFKTLHFRAKGQADPGRYKTAGIYIFSREGNLLLEQDHKIIID